ncbi:MAG: cache domain-containing protein, partial [Anaerolineaceae bacterium]
MNWFTRLTQKIHFNTIRKQLLLVFVLMTFLPVLATSIGGFFIGYSNGRQMVVDQLESLLLLKEQKISSWADDMMRELTTALDQEYIYDRITVVLDLTNENYYLEYYFKSVRSRMQRFLVNAQYFNEISLLDMDGDVVLSTNIDQEGSNYAGEAYFANGLRSKTIQFLVPSDNPADMIVVTALPVQNEDGQVMGLFVGKADLEHLREIIINPLGLGRTGKSFLANRGGILISTLGSAVQQTDQLSVNQLAITQQQRSGISYYNDDRGVRVVGAYLWLPRIKSTLFIEKDLTEVFGIILETMKVNVVVMLIAVMLAVFASLMVTRSIANPIMELSQRADGIARGDWSQIS